MIFTFFTRTRRTAVKNVQADRPEAGRGCGQPAAPVWRDAILPVVTIQVWTWPELVQLAGGRRQAERLLREKQVWRVMQGAYVGAEHPDGPEVRLAALHRVVPDHAVLAGRTALWALGLDLGTQPDPVEACVPRGKHLRPRDGVTVTSMQAPQNELVQVGARCVLSPARAVVDIARAEGLVEGVALADAVLRAGLATPELIAASLDLAAGLRGVIAARQVLEHVEPRSESLMESRLRMTMVLGRIPRPEAQVDFEDAQGRHQGRADLFLDGVVFEYDGYEVHDRKRVFMQDRRRANSFTNGGLVVCRFTSDDYYRRPHALLLSTARSALAEARARQGQISLVRGRDTLRPPALRPPLTLAQLRSQAA